VDAPHLDVELVRRVAHLARLGLADGELDGLTRQLAGLLAHFEALQEVDTTGVEPLTHALDTPGSAAPDEISCPADARSTLLPLTAHAREGFYVVPRVLEADFGTGVGTGSGTGSGTGADTGSERAGG
jgi:aspartyl-tRNA(Asn)/glutamyl-tRNA(Gln) amidotransferase subunit C